MKLKPTVQIRRALQIHKKKINIKTTAKREERKDNIKLNVIYPQKLLGAVVQLVHNCRVSMRSNFPSVEISFS